ncbi:gas vesicle protein G [Actinomadura craniellae]|uniref:Gas vesicle protein G n=1 Tax=Actinomadura craniellae TaxID=2231787 RepID=A0A365H3J0_9ACTN|nr:gas vesicle protein GvpG [Actinomadura craniellae]RAY13619.1 gas vesicle protein G [Actinomadura craniellae]
MGLLTMIVALPALPVLGVVRIGELLQEQAERELRGPAALRRELEKVEQERAAGLISAEEEARATEEILGRAFPAR